MIYFIKLLLLKGDYMKNLKIKHKLLISFASLSILIAVIVCFSLATLLESNQKADELLKTTLTKTETMSTMRKNFEQQWGLLKDLILFEPDSVVYNEAIDLLNTKEEEIQAAFITYEPLISSNKTIKGNFESMRILYANDFITLKNKVIEMTQNGENEDASKLLRLNVRLSSNLQEMHDSISFADNKITDEMTASIEAGFYRNIFVFSVICLFALVFIFFVLRYLSYIITRRIEDIVIAADSISLGNTDINVQTKFNDEIGKLVYAFNHMCDTINGQVQIVEEISHGNLTVSSLAQSDSDKMGNSLEHTIVNLNRLVVDIQDAANQVKLCSQMVTDGSNVLYNGVAEQYQIISNLEELTTDILSVAQKNVESIDNAQQQVQTAVNKIDNSTVKMSNIKDVISKINDLSTSITQINTVIQDISRETHILSINATIEAARAGSSGHSFIVVAQEVKELARKSSLEAEKIHEIADEAISFAAEGKAVTTEAAESLGKVYSITHDLKNVMDDIKASSLHQKNEIEKINSNIVEFSNIIKSYADSVSNSNIMAVLTGILQRDCLLVVNIPLDSRV